MTRLAANLSMMYQELPFLDRFAAAAQDGFEAVEYLFPYDYPPAELARRLQACGLTQALFNLPPGNWSQGERGIACLREREEEFTQSVQLALDYARATGCQRLHAMAGLVPEGADAKTLWATYVLNLRHAASVLQPAGITLLVEPINTRDMPGYFLNRQHQAHALLAEAGAPNLKVQMDFYHCQIMEGDLTRRLEEYLPHVGHVQIAGVPDRHEPDIGEVNYPHLLKRLDELGYQGFVGCEYRPRAITSDGLAWARPYLRNAREVSR